MFVKLEKIWRNEPNNLNDSLQSYLGYLKHVNAKKLTEQLKNRFLLDK